MLFARALASTASYARETVILMTEVIGDHVPLGRGTVSPSIVVIVASLRPLSVCGQPWTSAIMMASRHIIEAIELEFGSV